MKTSPPIQEALLIVFAIAVGGLVAFGVLSFLGLIALGQWAFWPAGENFLVRVTLAPWWLRLAIPVLGGLVLGPVIAFLAAPEIRGPGIPEIIKAAALQDSYIRPKVTVLKSLCTALAITAGASVGREGPVATIGAAIGSSLGRLFKFSPQKVRVALACGAAAGIAATFNAPFAGTLFAVEIILGDLQIAYLGPIALTSIISVIVVRRVWEGFPILVSPAFEFRHPEELVVYLILGLLSGLLAILFTRGVYASDTFFRKFPLPEWGKPALGGLGLGLIAIWFPNVFGVGYDSINLALTGKLTLGAAGPILLAKFLATIICLGSMSGGVIGPSLFLGAMLGTSLALGGNLIFPHLYLNPVDYALVGMGTVVSGVTLAPITAILIILELTQDYRTILPLLVSCVTSLLVVKSLYGPSIYQAKLLRRGIRLVRGVDANILRTLKVTECMTAHIETINEEEKLPKILEKAQASAFPFFMVLDQRRELSGVLTIADLREDLRFARRVSRDTTAAQLMTKNMVTIAPEDNLETALELLEGKNLSCLPVVLPPEGKKVVGLLKQEDLMTAYKQRLLKVRLLQANSAGQDR
jgi:CIC family chloride channel protein